uniref:Avidin n=1 Tax=Chrysemys picta bellii TaxID=8478 RepID=A0A8C3FF46_CHRPI
MTGIQSKTGLQAQTTGPPSVRSIWGSQGIPAPPPPPSGGQSNLSLPPISPPSFQNSAFSDPSHSLCSVSRAKCILTGTWQNDLGSNMTISAVNEAGQFYGSYLTTVSAAEKPILVSPLNGSQHIDDMGQPTFGFTVTWSFSDSTTVFVGQCFVDDHGEETLQTMWLLREKVKSAEDNWKATTRLR